MKILLLLSLVFIILHGFSKNREDDANMKVCGRWAINDSMVYSVKQSCQKFSGKKQLCEEITEYDAVITVDSIIPEGFIFKWKCCHVQVLSPHIFLQKIGTLCDGIEILYETDKNGTFIKLINYEEVRECLSNSINLLAKHYANIPNMDAILEQFRSNFATPKAMEASLLREIPLFHSLHGENISTTKSREFKKRVPNLFGGTSFPGICSIEVENFDLESKVCTVAVNQIIDKEQARNNIYKYLKNLSRRMAHPVPDKNQIPKIQVNDSSQISINMHSGWLVSATSNEFISAGPIQQRTCTTISQKK